MDWNLAIDRNREALKRIVAMLAAMAGLGQSAVGSRHSGAEPETDCLSLDHKSRRQLCSV